MNENEPFDLDINEDVLDAVYNLAIQLEENGDQGNAVQLLKIGVHFGHANSMNVLANFLTEPPTFKDFKTAEVLYKKACLAGNPAACSNLALTYWQLGKPIPAQKYWKMAKDRGDPWADEGPPWEHNDDD
ncbi:hypothetical protein [Azospirillum sp. B4]|uniref:hypothetical protein n=1 Tax=Azospirillum sp. B4 TaxID=95605 RepID=UPI0011DDD7E6|nr:hypothetical protein [Azospirillum sp. B4]